MDVRILGTVHILSGLGLVSGVSLFPVHNKARENHPLTVFFCDHIRLRGIHDRHSLELEHPLPFGFDRLSKTAFGPRQKAGSTIPRRRSFD